MPACQPRRAWNLALRRRALNCYRRAVATASKTMLRTAVTIIPTATVHPNDDRKSSASNPTTSPTSKHTKNPIPISAKVVAMGRSARMMRSIELCIARCYRQWEDAVFPESFSKNDCTECPKSPGQRFRASKGNVLRPGIDPGFRDCSKWRMPWNCV